MTTKRVLLSAVLTIALTLPVFGQGTRDDTTKSGMKRLDLSSMRIQPTVDATVEGVHIKVWLMTQKEHKEMMKEKKGQMMMYGEKEGAMGEMGMKDSSMGKDMKGMKHDGMGMNKAMMDSMMAGTHHIMLVVTDSTSGKEIADASAKVLIEFPSKKNWSADLKPMMNHFGGGLTLDEKGKYQFTVIVKVDGVPKTTKFQYKVK